jgi:hypothetical protein
MGFRSRNRISTLLMRISRLIILFFMVLFIDTGCDKLTDEEAFIEPQTMHGVVKDMSQTNGCGLVVVLDNGTVIVPYKLDTSMILAEGQEVEIAYTELTDTNYYCNAGVVADVTWMEQSGCSPIIKIQSTDSASVYTNLPSDPFTINDAKIDGDCLQISLSFSGGCAAHEFIMTYTDLPGFDKYDYNGKLTLGHNSHGDSCEAYITQTISFDLKPLQNKESDMIRLILVKEGDKEGYQLIIDYYYK